MYLLNLDFSPGFESMNFFMGSVYPATITTKSSLLSSMALRIVSIAS